MMSDMLVDVRNLSITIDTFRGPLRIIRNQDITLRRGEILGIVGESGCGKSVMDRFRTSTNISLIIYPLPLDQIHCAIHRLRIQIQAW